MNIRSRLRVQPSLRCKAIHDRFRVDASRLQSGHPGARAGFDVSIRFATRIRFAVKVRYAATAVIMIAAIAAIAASAAIAAFAAAPPASIALPFSHGKLLVAIAFQQASLRFPASFASPSVSALQPLAAIDPQQTGASLQACAFTFTLTIPPSTFRSSIRGMPRQYLWRVGELC